MAEGIYQELVDVVTEMRANAGLVDAFVLIWGDYSVDQQVRWTKRGPQNLRNDLIFGIAASLLAVCEKQVGSRREAMHIFMGEIYKKMPDARADLHRAFEKAQNDEE